MSLLYEFVKVPVYLAHSVYFRKVHLLNLEKVPVDKPVMLLPNHPNAFLDAVVVSIQLHQQVNFLVRSDVFNSPVKKWLLAKLNNYPIYRIQEGTENLKKNEETFRVCSELFKKNKTVLIFPEGICIREKRLRKLKKGAARIAFGSEEQSDFSLDLKLVPVGVNYSEFGTMGGELILNFGDPLSIQEYIDLYTNEKAKAINELTGNIESALSALVIRVPSEEEDELFNQVENIRFSAVENGAEKFRRKKRVADRLIHLKENSADLLSRLKEISKSYFNTLENKRTTDEAVAGYIKWDLIKDLFLLIMSPLFVIGSLLNLLPLKLSYALANKMVSKEEFFDSVNMIGGMFIFIMYYFILMIPASFIITNGYLLVTFILSVPLMGMIALGWWRMFQKRKAVKAFKGLHEKESLDLIRKREEILSLIR